MLFRRREFALFIAFVFGCITFAHAQICHSFEPGEVVHIHKSLSIDSIGLANTDNYDIVYHRIAVKLDPRVRYIEGNVTSYFRPLTSLTQIAFDLMDALSVDSIYYHGIRLSTFTHTDNAVTISFPATVTALDSVAVYYHGVPPEGNDFGSFVADKHFDGTDSVPVLWTLSEPYGARVWWPCKMTLTDKIDSLDTYVNVPTGNRAGSNGLMKDSVVTGSTTTYHWRERYPIATYLVGIAVTNYTSHSFTVHTQQGDIMVLDYAYPEYEAEWEASDSNVAQALRLYSDLFGAYPFIKEKYGHAQFGWGGGMEHQTMSFITGVNFELVNHEMAHQWFGDKLTCDSWSEIWLNEGFAVFLAGLCYERMAPEWWYAWRKVNLAKSLSGENGTVLCDDTTSVPRIFSNSLTYSKGAYLLHMLRGQLGDDAFFRAIKNYVNDPALIYSFSKTELLKAHLEAESGQDLAVFFDQWFYNGGYPSYALDWSQQGTKLSLKLSQSTSTRAVQFFTMPVPVKFYGKSVDTTLVLHHTSSGQEFSYDIPFAIDSAVIDPEIWLISAGNTVRRVPAIDKDDFLVIVPNPVHDKLTIWYDSKNLHTVTLNIYNAEGQKVSSESIPAGNDDYYTANVSGLAAGVYITKIVTEKGIHTQRIVKY